MKFTTILVGNGLGRAINNEFFDLETAVRNHWNGKDEYLSTNAKQAILRCLPGYKEGANTIPSSEDDLLMLQEAVVACQTLTRLERPSGQWLTDLGREFPSIVSQFIGKTAFHFHSYDRDRLPSNYKKFLNGIEEFIRSRNCHLVTLNYDNLLYQPLIEKEVLDGYNGCLIDGFWTSGFDEENLVRKTNPNQGWYIHLHGSPLFYQSEDAIKKLPQNELLESFKGSIKRRHVVLTHNSKKFGVIAASPLLNTYFQHFNLALYESNRLIVFGYGRQDIHVNKAISDWIRSAENIEKSIEIVLIERQCGDKSGGAAKKWIDGLLPKEARTKVVLTIADTQPNILDFDWSSIPKEIAC